ncbi:MAG TPA: ATP-binding protein, partial [Longimicrobiaceae bacterium]
RAERMRHDLVSVVSHELRTPLTAVRAALGLLCGGLLDARPERARDMLDTALRNTERLMKLANDLLDVERFASGQSAVEPRPYSAAELMTQAAEVVREAAAASGVWVVVHPAAAVVRADPDRVNQVLVNLLANAVKFSEAGGTVWLGAEVSGGEARFCVRDRGRGIPPDRLHSVFEPFAQVDSSDARRQKGVGLGLAIARGIVERHGGRIWAESEPGKGSSFFFTLPLAV